MTSDEKRTPESRAGSGGAADTATSADTAYPRVSDEEAAPASPESPNNNSNNVTSQASASSHPGAEGEQGPRAASEGGQPGSAASEGGQPGSAASAGGAAVSAEDELAARAAKAEEYLALAQRTKADFENYRKRAIREAATAQERGALRLAQDLLPAIDNLERALAHAEAEGADGAGDDQHSFVAGIRHVHADVIAALGRAGIESYSPQGEPFDPQYHEAVAQHPVAGAEPGTVVEVFQRGYRTGSSVVRPARVVVAG